jgi:excisionase family DNA binding protein
MSEHKESDMLTVEDIMADLRISEATIRRWIRDGSLEAFKLGRQYRVRRADYEKFLEKRRMGQIPD